MQPSPGSPGQNRSLVASAAIAAVIAVGAPAEADGPSGAGELRVELLACELREAESVYPAAAAALASKLRGALAEVASCAERPFHM